MFNMTAFCPFFHFPCYEWEICESWFSQEILGCNHFNMNKKEMITSLSNKQNKLKKED